jgi:ribonuclease P protein component
MPASGAAAPPVTGRAPRLLAQGLPACVEVLTRRADYLRAAQGRRQGMPGFLLQARERDEAAGGGEGRGALRIGFTCSRKIGNAVARNRAKRRLRALARDVLAAAGRPGWDYVLVGRPGTTATHPFAALCDDLRRALAVIHAAGRPRPPAATPPRDAGAETAR